jgi:hypothetical protein
MLQAKGLVTDEVAATVTTEETPAAEEAVAVAEETPVAEVKATAKKAVAKKAPAKK